MKRLLLALLFLLPQLSFAEIVFSERAYSTLIKPVSINATIVDFETTSGLIIKAPASKDLDNMILLGEIREKNVGIRKVGEKLYYVMRVILYGVSEKSNKAALRNALKGKEFEVKCQSLIRQTYSGTLPACQILNDGEDVFLKLAKKDSLKSDLIISTSNIHTSLKIYQEYEKEAGNLIISRF